MQSVDLGTDHVVYVAAAARVASALSQDVLLAPIESSVIPLPHQIRVLSRAMSEGHVRYLLADEVGLGKTIEAGLILRELKLRGLVERTLVVVPRGLLTQWVSEMRTHFGEEFQLLIPSDFAAYRRFTGDDNIWRVYDQVVCPLDSVKPLDGRRGWSHEQLAQYNRERFEDLVAAGWDLVIVDEAHRLGGSTEQIARYRLGRALADAVPYLLLLSATPHQGKTDAFQRLVSLLDGEVFPDEESVTRERVQPYVIRTEKRHAIDSEGRPLFRPRRTSLIAVSWEDRHGQQRALYEAVTEYVREGYNRAVREKRAYIGFLMILMQRLVTSSTRAIRSTLERRLEALRSPGEQLPLFAGLPEDEWADMDGQEQVDVLLKSRLQALASERAEVELLLEAARRTEQAGCDAKAEALLEWLYRLQQEERDAELKALVFTEFISTQEMLQEYLSARGFRVACLNGTMSIDQRLRAQREFAADARILVSTDAGGEGLNLQFAHVVINYDLPWNPMRLEQRIGRVDRIGQEHPVRAINLVLRDTVECRVQEVLEEKLRVILAEFGVDKTGDVLDSAYASELFDELYLEALLDTEGAEERVDALLERIREEAKSARESASVLDGGEELDPAEARRVMENPLFHWVEQMTVSYLRSHGGSAERHGKAWDLCWPDGSRDQRVVFTARDAAAVRGARQLTLEDAGVRHLAERLPLLVPGQPMPTLSLPSLPKSVHGVWSLWQIGIRPSVQSPQEPTRPGWRQRRHLALFVHEDGRTLLPTARRIWDVLLVGQASVGEQTPSSDAAALLHASRVAAETHGRALYEELRSEHRRRLEHRRSKGEYAFSARQRVIERIGLPEVRAHRLTEMEQEKLIWRRTLEAESQVVPEMVPLLLLRVRGEATNG
ncbi:DEAD/DEAH box helicase [Planctomycetota bacterium]